MKSISLIACVGQDRGLGYQNQLLWRIPADQQFFRQITTGATVVMGAHTFSSIGRPLPHRQNYILTRHPERLNLGDPSPQLQTFASFTALETALKELSTPIFIIGGSSLYQHFLPTASRLLLTEVHATRPADVFFPEFNPADFTRRVLQTGTHADVNYEIVEYQRR